MVKNICDILNVEYPKDMDKLPHVNPSLNDSEAYHKRKLNIKYRHDFGNLIFEHSNIHRSRKFFEREKFNSIEDYFRDVKMKRLLLNQAKNKAEKEEKISYNTENEIFRKVLDEIKSSNKRLSNNYDLKLIEKYLNP